MVRFLIETSETGKIANPVKVANRTTEISCVRNIILSQFYA